MNNPPASTFVLLGIPTLAALVLGMLGAGSFWAERALGATTQQARARAAWVTLAATAWAVFTLLLAESGLLMRFEARPPPFLLLMIVTLVGALLVGLSPSGKRLALGLPLWALVGFQGFRLPLELVMHRAALEGTMPIEMSFSGYNFDIVSGATALLLSVALARGVLGKRAAVIWNVLGVLLLANIVVIAVAATPKFHAFGPTHLNTWVGQPPFVLLPSVLVMAAARPRPGVSKVELWTSARRALNGRQRNAGPRSRRSVTRSPTRSPQSDPERISRHQTPTQAKRPLRLSARARHVPLGARVKRADSAEKRGTEPPVGTTGTAPLTTRSERVGDRGPAAHLEARAGPDG